MINTEVHGISRLLDLFILPSKLVIDDRKARRAVESSFFIINKYQGVKDWRQINDTIKSSLYYMVVYDNEWLDSRLVSDLRSALIYSRGIDMFVVFLAEGGGQEVFYQPRVFSSQLRLSLDENQPLPPNHQSLKFEKLIGGWLYVD